MNKILYIFVFFIIGCSSNITFVEQMLSNGGEKYWMSDSSNYEKCFLIDGSYIRTTFDEEDNKRYFYGNPYGDDIIIGKDTWEVVDDSTIVFNGHIRCIIIHLSDSLFTYCNISNGNRISNMRKSKFQDLKPIER